MRWIGNRSLNRNLRRRGACVRGVFLLAKLPINRYHYPMRTDILGVPIDAVTRNQAMERIKAAFLAKKTPYFIVTPNPEFVVLAQKDPEFRAVLNKADLAIPDGVGLLWAARRRGRALPERVTGADLAVDVCGWAAEEGKTVYLLGGDPDMAARSAEVLRDRFSGLKIVGAEQGGWLDYDRTAGEWRWDDGTMERLQAAKPDILLVGLAFGKQEKWLCQERPNMPWLGLAMGVGGTFEFLGGKVRRAPDWMRRIGLEWLWRLVRQPSRWRRIFRATVVFPYLVIRDRR